MAIRHVPKRMSWVMDAVLVRTPVQPILASKTAGRLVVLAYHGIVDPARFSLQIEYLRETMEIVSLSEVLQAITGERTLPARSVLITFDDADRSIVEYAAPILNREGVPAVAFVVAGHLDTDRPFWWNEVEELYVRGASLRDFGPNGQAWVKRLKEIPDSDRRRVITRLRRAHAGSPVKALHLKKSDLGLLGAAGISIGNHTMTHPVLDRCSDRRIASEIRRSHKVLFRATGAAPRAFAYPNGNYDVRAVKVMKGLGYEAGFLFDHRTCPFPPIDPFRVSRVRVSSATPLDRFRLIISGLHPALHHALGRS